MKSDTRRLFLFSFLSFMIVILMGTLNAPLKKSFQNTDIWTNVTLFHSHFDQLSWLGSAAIGAIFYFL